MSKDQTTCGQLLYFPLPVLRQLVDVMLNHTRHCIAGFTIDIACSCHVFKPLRRTLRNDFYNFCSKFIRRNVTTSRIDIIQCHNNRSAICSRLHMPVCFPNNSKNPPKFIRLIVRNSNGDQCSLDTVPLGVGVHHDGFYSGFVLLVHGTQPCHVLHRWHTPQ